MLHVVHISNRIEIPAPGKPTAGGLDESIAIPPPGVRVTRIGWSGRVIEDSLYAPKRAVEDKTIGNVRYITMDFSASMERGFYSGMANGFLWPLFHGRPELSGPAFSIKDAAAYERVNATLATLAKKYIRPDDVIVVHDYHFIPLGSLLARAGLSNPSSFFLHIPVPELEAVLACGRRPAAYVWELFRTFRAYDLVGLQSRRDANALMVALNMLDIRSAVADDTRYPRDTQFSVLPVIGNTARYIRDAKNWENHPDTIAFQAKYGPARIIGVDRMDYSKGLPNKFRALALAHADHMIPPDFHFLQVAPPGRTNVPAYIQEARLIRQTYRDLRAAFGNVATLHMNKVRREILLGLFRRSAIGLVTPLKDGMNLVALEYIAAQNPENPGVLVLSRQAGASGLLADAAVLADADNPPGIATALRRAATMPVPRRITRHQAGLKALSAHTNREWQLSLINGAIAAARRRPAAPRRRIA